MKVQVILGEQLEQINLNQVINNQNQPVSFNKLVNPSLFFKIPFIPGSLDLAIVAATQGMSKADHNTKLFFRKVGSTNILADTGNLPIPAALIQEGEGVNLNVEFKKIIIREEGEYEAVVSIDDEEFSQTIFIKGIEKLTA